jgi:hypothetical protein
VKENISLVIEAGEKLLTSCFLFMLIKALRTMGLDLSLDRVVWDEK